MMTFDLAHKQGRCVFAEETRDDRSTKIFSAHRVWERGGYDLLKGRLISWVNPRLFVAGTSLDTESESESWQ